MTTTERIRELIYQGDRDKRREALRTFYQAHDGPGWRYMEGALDRQEAQERRHAIVRRQCQALTASMRRELRQLHRRVRGDA